MYRVKCRLSVICSIIKGCGLSCGVCIVFCEQAFQTQKILSNIIMVVQQLMSKCMCGPAFIIMLAPKPAKTFKDQADNIFIPYILHDFEVCEKN